MKHLYQKSNITTHIPIFTLTALIVVLLSACGEGVVTNNGTENPPGEVPFVPLNDTGVNYFIDDSNTFFYEKIANKEWLETQTALALPNDEYEKSGSPKLYTTDRTKFPKLPEEVFNNELLEPSNFPGQDASTGSDVFNNNDLDGVAGFSFTKLHVTTGEPLPLPSAIANEEELAALEKQWGCVKDNVTGLTWEHKTEKPKKLKVPADSEDPLTIDWHYAGGIFSWYDPNNNTNGGDPGQQNGGQCAGDIVIGDTLTLINISNSEALCGKTNWRLPTAEELRSLVNYQVKRGTLQFPAMTDQEYFPRLASMDHRWTSQTVNIPTKRNKAFGFHFHEGQMQAHVKACQPSEISQFRNGALLVSDP